MGCYGTMHFDITVTLTYAGVQQDMKEAFITIHLDITYQNSCVCLPCVNTD